MMGQFSGKGWQIAIGFLALCAGTVAADWQGAQRLDLDGLGNAADARIEVADGGFVAAAWRQNIEFSSNVQVAVDDAGQAIAVWQQSDGNLVTVRANYWDGQAWIGPEQIDADADKAGTTPDIDLDSEGNAVAIWRLSDGSTRRIETADFDGSDWSGSVAIDPGSQRLTGPRVGLAGNGKAVATWSLDASGNRRVYGNTRHDGAWGEALLLDDGGDTNISNAELAVDRAGRAFVVWNQSDGTRTRTVARRWDGSTWLPLELLDNGLNPTFSAQIALAGDGSGAAAWLESVNGELQVFVARLDFDPIFADRFEAASDAGPADAGAEKPSAL